MVIPAILYHRFNSPRHRLCHRIRQIADADHMISFFFPALGHKLPLPAHTNRTVGIFCIAHQIPGIPLIFRKRIFPAPEVARHKIRFAKLRQYLCQGMQIVFLCILHIDNQLHAILVNQIVVLFLFKTNDNINFLHLYRMKLTDQPLDQRFPLYFQKPFRRFHIDRHHPHSISGSQNHRVFRAMLCHLKPGFFRQLHICC